MSMKSLFLTLFALFCIVAFAFAGVARADEDDEPQVIVDDAAPEDAEYDDALSTTAEEESAEELSQPDLTSASDVAVSMVFADYPNGQIPAGQIVDVVVGFENKGVTTYTVDMLYGFLVSPYDAHQFVQNFTGLSYNTSIAPGESASILYHFRPEASLNTVEYRLMLLMNYENEDFERFVNVFFNSTVGLVESESASESKTQFLYGVTAVLAVIVFVLVSRTMAKNNAKTARSAAAAQSTDGGASNEWLAGTAAAAKSKSSSAPRSPSPKATSRSTSADKSGKKK